MKRALLSALGVVALAIIAAAIYWRPDRAVQVASGQMAHNLCSATFISGLDPEAKVAARCVASGFPKDGFFASGQRIYIIPSEHLIVARFGYSPEPDFGIIEDLALIKTAIAALRSSLDCVSSAHAAALATAGAAS